MQEQTKYNNLFSFLKTILLAIVGFITSFVLVYKKLQELNIDLGAFGLLILTSILIIWLICIYLRFANFLKLSKEPFTPLLKNIGAIGMVAIPLLALGGWSAKKWWPTNKIIILVANFAEKDEYSFGTNIRLRLEAAAKGYRDMEISSLEFISENQGRKVAIHKGQEQGASLVIWGSYDMPSEICQVRVHIEALRDPKILPILLEQDTWTTQFMAKKAEICEFEPQCKLAQKMSCVVLLSMGLARYKAKDFEKAISWFNEALKYANDMKIVDQVESCMIYLSIGNSHLSRGNLEEAINNFSKAIEIDPKFALAYNNRGYVYNKQGKYGLALLDLGKAIDLDPKLASAYNNRGFAYGHKNEYDLALKDYNKAIKLEPSFAEAYNNRGFAYGHKNEYDSALEDFNKAIKLEPSYAEAYNNRGYIYREISNYDSALNDFDKCIELDPKMAQAYCNRGFLYFKKDKYEQALHDLDVSIKLDPNLVKAYYYRGLVFCNRGEKIKAHTDWEKASQLNQDPKLRELIEQGINGLDCGEKGVAQN